MIPPLGFFDYLARVRQHRAFAFLVVLFLLFLALSILAHSPSLLQFDQRVTRGLQRYRSEPMDRFMRLVTALADPVTLIGLGVVGTLIFWFSGRPWAGVACALAVLGLPLNYGIKQLIRRPRPDSALVNVLLPVVGRSFPSGHAMTAIMFYGLLAFLVWVHVSHPVWRVFGAVGLAVLAFTIGLTRVYLGVHWFSDVVGGWTAGLFFLLILTILYRAVTETSQVARG